MQQGGGRFLRDNAFLVAAVALPAVVVGLFLLASAIPRWTVPDPSYDFVVRAGGPFDQALPRVAIDFAVQDGRIEATIRPLNANAYPQLATLFLVEHDTLNVREIKVEIPNDLKEGDPPRTIPVDLPGGRRVVAGSRMPDGYELGLHNRRGGGIVSDIFGMNRYGQEVVLVNGGRVITIALPSPYRYQSPVTAVGWLENEGSR